MDKKNKLLYIVNIDFPPMSGPGVWRMLALAKYAALAGHRVHVFCADRSFWNNRFDHALMDQLPDAVKITRIRTIYENDIQDKLELWRKSSSPLKRKIGAQLYWWVQRYFPDQILHWVIKATTIICLKGQSEKPDAILTTGPMHLVHAAGWALSSIRKTTWVMDYRDPWTGDPAYGQVHPGPYQEKLMVWLENKLIRKANWVTAVTPGFLAPLLSRFVSEGIAAKFKVIANGHDMEVTQSSCSEVDSNSKLLSIHFNGTIQREDSAFENLLKAVARYRKSSQAEEKPAIRLSFCGTNQKLREHVANLELSDWLHDYGPLSQIRSQQVSREADILLVAVKADLATSKGVVPAKLYEALALGKPVLALVPDPSDVRDILAEDTASLCVDPRHEEGIFGALNQLAINKRDAQHDSVSQDALKRTALATRFSRRVLCAEMLQLIEFDTPDPQPTPLTAENI